MAARKSMRGRQRTGIALAFVFAGTIFFATVSPSGEWLMAPGGMTSGHEKLSCESCHLKAPGTLRQQLQAKVQYWLGNRQDTVSLGHVNVGNDECLACHSRPKDTHPVYRFLEPRYREARQTLAPQFCISCHQEHQNERVSVQPEICKTCHSKIMLKRDPLDIPHKKLAQDNQWKTCLGCHDFHGNHSIRSPELVKERIDESDIAAYLGDGYTPYPLPKKYKAKSSLRNEIK